MVGGKATAVLVGGDEPSQSLLGTSAPPQPLAFDLGCGLGGWTEGLQAVGYHVIGVDIVAHAYDGERYPGSLWIQDVRTIHGSQLRGASLIVASMPCTEYSYMAMPWRRAKQIAAALRGEGPFPDGYRGSRTIAELNELFDACFRIQREASVAAGRHIPMVVENVKGAQPWVGRARTSFGSYFLWGDIPALMPVQRYHQRLKVSAGEQWNINRPNFTGTIAWDEGLKNPGFRFDGSGRSFQTASVEGVKAKDADGYERNHPAAFGWKSPRTSSSAVSARKAASAKIAKIPLTLSTWIGRAWLPTAHPRSLAA